MEIHNISDFFKFIDRRTFKSSLERTEICPTGDNPEVLLREGNCLNDPFP